jgi:hypothetical protein
VILEIIPIISNGGSTGLAPIHVKIIKFIDNIQNKVLLMGLNFLDRRCFLNMGIIPRIKIAAISAITPPNLLGIERKIAYANRKYHSGWIWIGVFNGLAGIKFSGSTKIKGFKVEIDSKIAIVIIIVIISFCV